MVVIFSAMPSAVSSSMHSSAMTSAMPCSSRRRSLTGRPTSLVGAMGVFTVCMSASQVHVAWRDVEGHFLIGNHLGARGRGAAIHEEDARRAAHRRQRSLNAQRHLDPSDAKQIGVEAILFVVRWAPGT